MDPHDIPAGDVLFSPWLWLVVVLVVAWLTRAWRLLGIVFVPEEKTCVVTKRWTLFRPRLTNGRIVAVNGEAGLQAATLTPGLHFLLFPWQYAVRFDDLTVIQPGRLGKVTLIDGEPISPGRVLGRHVDCNFFQDLSTFLRNHGQRGPQSTILPPGTYRLNTRAVFVNAEVDERSHEKVADQPALVVPPNKVAIITTMDGNPLPQGEIAGPIVNGHAQFQDADAFVRAGGCRGLQTQVLEPDIDAWFRNAAQQRLAIEFIESRQSIQDSAADYIRNELAKYDVEGVATLIGDTPPPEKLATPRQEKQVAEQQKEMYAVQRDAQAVREQMEEQRALADTKARVVSAQRDVTVAEQEARAAVARADGEAGAIRKIAEANAARETLVGMAQAGVLEAKVSAIGRDNWTTMEVITNLAEQHVPIVPQVVAGGGDGAGGGNVAGALLGVLAARMLRPEMPVPPAPPSE